MLCKCKCPCACGPRWESSRSFLEHPTEWWRSRVRRWCWTRGTTRRWPAAGPPSSRCKMLVQNLLRWECRLQTREGKVPVVLQMERWDDKVRKPPTANILRTAGASFDVFHENCVRFWDLHDSKIVHATFCNALFAHDFQHIWVCQWYLNQDRPIRLSHKINQSLIFFILLIICLLSRSQWNWKGRNQIAVCFVWSCCFNYFTWQTQTLKRGESYVNRRRFGYNRQTSYAQDCFYVPTPNGQDDKMKWKFLQGRHFLQQWWRWARLDDRRWAARGVSWDEVLKVGGSHQQLPTPPFSTQIRLDQPHICHLWWNPHLLLTWDQDANQNRAQRFKQDEGISWKHLQSNPPRELSCYQMIWRLKEAINSCQHLHSQLKSV